MSDIAHMRACEGGNIAPVRTHACVRVGAREGGNMVRIARARART